MKAEREHHRKHDQGRPRNGEAAPPNGRSATPPGRENGSELRGPKPDAEFEKKGEISPALFRRDDWMEFRDPNRISNKAGVPFAQLPQAAVKELCDDALDAAGNAEFGLLEVTGDAVTFCVADAGPGLDGTDEQLAELY